MSDHAAGNGDIMHAGPTTEPKAAMDLFALLHNLKATKRTGWIRKGVDGPESIADHMMALAHDMAEAVVGDITPHDGVSKEDKERREREAMTAMCSSLGTAAGAQLLELWEEYEAGVSPEALLLKDLDKLEMILQAYEYEQAQRMSLEEFFTSTAGKFKTATGQVWAAEVVRRRMQSAAAPDCAPSALLEGGKTSAEQP